MCAGALRKRLPLVWDEVGMTISVCLTPNTIMPTPEFLSEFREFYMTHTGLQTATHFGLSPWAVEHIVRKYDIRKQHRQAFDPLPTKPRKPQKGSGVIAPPPYAKGFRWTGTKWH